MIKFADKTMLQDLKLIWKECFHDSNEYIEFFFQSYFGIQTTLVYCVDERPVSMLTLMPATLHTSNDVKKVYYLYAVATLPSFQGNGYSSMLLKYANNITKGATFLQPATSELEQFYQNNGYRVLLNRTISDINDILVRDLEVKVATLIEESSDYQVKELYAVDSGVYTDIRNAFYKQEGYIAWDEQVIAYAISENKFTGGRTLLINDEYIVMYRVYEGTLYIREYTMPEEMLLDFIHSMPESRVCKECKVYLNNQGASKCIQKQVIMSTFSLNTQDGYFNLAFE